MISQYHGGKLAARSLKTQVCSSPISQTNRETCQGPQELLSMLLPLASRSFQGQHSLVSAILAVSLHAYWHSYKAPGEKRHGLLKQYFLSVGILCNAPKENGFLWGFPGGPVVKNPPCKATDTSLSPDLGISDMPRSN